MAVATPPIAPNGASHDILASDPRPVPVVPLVRRRARSSVRTQARPVVPRRRLGQGPADRHHLDPSGAERPVPPLLIGAFHVCLWTFTLTEAWAWGRMDEALVDRSASPWDSTLRRPSHADKRRAWRRELLGEEIRAVLHPGATQAEIQAMAERLLSLAA
jgi:hypothetical protein